MKMTFSEPTIVKIGVLMYTGKQRAIVEDGEKGSVEYIEVLASTRRGVYRKLERARAKLRHPAGRTRQVQRGGAGSVQIQSGGDVHYEP